MSRTKKDAERWHVIPLEPNERDLAQSVDQELAYEWDRSGWEGEAPSEIRGKTLRIRRMREHMALADFLRLLEQGRFRERHGAKAFARKIRRETQFAGRL